LAPLDYELNSIEKKRLKTRMLSYFKISGLYIKYDKKLHIFVE